MRLVLLGPPGCGKGTQGEKISKKYNIPRFSTGDILRAAIKNGTPLGKKAATFMNRGELVPDELVVDLMAEPIASHSQGFILDGFPRTVGQALGLVKILEKNGIELDAVVNITVAEDAVVKRLGGRRQCSKCGALYHIEYSPSKKDGVCDKCSGSLYQRDDDKEETIRNRLRAYKNETAPLVDYYKTIIKNVDGNGKEEEVFSRISSLI